MTIQPTLRERRKRETQRLILDAAFRLLSTQGYGQTSVDGIIAEAGLSKGAFYHHFESKEALFKALLEERQRRCIDQMQRAVAPAASVREAIENLVRVTFDFCEDDPAWVRLYFEFCLQATREGFAREIVAASLSECRQIVASMLKAGQPGDVRSDLDADSAAVLLISLFDGVFLHWAVDSQATNFSALARPTADLIERFVTTSKQASRADSPTRQKNDRRRSK